jgi:hypothetical protein
MVLPLHGSFLLHQPDLRLELKRSKRHVLPLPRGAILFAVWMLLDASQRTRSSGGKSASGTSRIDQSPPSPSTFSCSLTSLSNRQAAGAAGVVVVSFGWYLFAALLLKGAEAPLQLPLGDLSRFFGGKKNAVEAM